MRRVVLYATAVFCLVLLHTAESCNVEVIVTANSTNITSPGYPYRVYPSNLVCWWKVVAANGGNSVGVEVLDSIIDYSDDCIYNSLKFYDGPNSSSSMIGDICGTQKGAFVSSGNSMYIQFNTDSSRGYKGFLLKVYEVPNSCDTEIVVNANASNISSPGYPGLPYPGNLNCWWKVVAADRDNNVGVEVVDSVIETSYNCYADSLAFYDGLNSSSPRIARICGNQMGAYISTGNTMYIQFQTDYSVGYKGFLLKVYEIPKCVQDLTATTNTSTLVSPGYPDDYFNNMRCSWVITAENENDTVVLEVISSDIQDGGCNFDSVTVYNGNTTNHYDSLGTFCGHDVPTFQSSKNQLMIIFVSDSSIVRSGFKMLYRSVNADDCSRNLSVDLQDLYFVSPGYPDGVYSDMECVWTIVSPSFSTIFLRTMTIDIEQSENCTNASVTVYSGYMSNELGSFCGNKTHGYGSLENVLTVVFKTGDVAAGEGFRIGYISMGSEPATVTTPTTTPAPANCGSYQRTAFTASQYLQSPGYPQAYENNEQCYWAIQAVDTTMMVRIVVLDSQLENSPDCKWDYVKVFDGSSNRSPLLQTWCGDMKPTVQSSQQFMLLQFRTDVSDVFKGFKLKYFETSDPYSCGDSLSVDFTATTLTSPGYPHNYMNNLNCVWTIHTFYNNIKLDVQQSNIEWSFNCQNDYVKVNDGSSTYSQLLGRFCGTDTPTYYSTGHYVTITFHSDNSITNKGFSLLYTGGTYSTCGEQDLVAYTFTEDFTSPNYPLSYPSNADCTWRIDTQNSDYVVYISVLTSSIEYSTGCTSDYVEAFDGFDDSYTSLGRWCGYDLPDKHSSGEYMFIKFHTDSSNTDSGFRISYRKQMDNFPDDYSSHVAAIVGGTVGGIVFIGVVCILIAAVAKKSTPPTTRVQDNRGHPGNIHATTQGRFQTTVTPAAFQPPPSYYQVVNGEQRGAVGTVAPPPAYSPTAGTVAPPPAPAPTVGTVQSSPAPPSTVGIAAPTPVPTSNVGTVAPTPDHPPTVVPQSPTQTTETVRTEEPLPPYPETGVTSDTAPIVDQQ